MPKKLVIYREVEEAKTRKATLEMEKERERDERAQREQEEKFWAEAEVPKPKSVRKRQEDAERKAEAAAKRAEAKKMAEEEQEELEKSLKGVNQKQTRVTAAQLAKAKEDKRQKLEKLAAQNRWGRTMDETQYKRLVMVDNTNRDDMAVDAGSVDSALAQLFEMKSTSSARRPVNRRLSDES